MNDLSLDQEEPTSSLTNPSRDNDIGTLRVQGKDTPVRVNGKEVWSIEDFIMHMNDCKLGTCRYNLPSCPLTN